MVQHARVPAQRAPPAAAARVHNAAASRRAAAAAARVRAAAPAAVLWDLDNLRPASASDLPALAALIVQAVAALAPAGDAAELRLTAAANVRTLAALGEADVAAALAAAGGELLRTSGRSQAVDLALRTRAAEFVADFPGARLAVVSDDNGFSGILAYARGRGCDAVAVGEHARRRRPAWAAPAPLGALALPRAAGAAIALRRPRAAGGAWEVAEAWREEGSSSAAAPAASDLYF
jgi:hypothetical protein